LPGFSGFVAELQVLLGAWRVFPWFVVACGFGLVIGVAYVLRAIHHGFYGKTDRGALEGSSGTAKLPPISWPEKLGALLLLACTLVVGLYPQVLLRWIEPGVSGWLSVFTRRLP
jgi:NADH-quinone oxidoreductase subunit M